MKKRLRKKNKVGEFREDGFVIKARLDTANGEEFADALIDFVEGLGCEVGGGGGPTTIDLFCTRRKGTCTELDRLKVQGFLKDHPMVEEFRVGPLVDAWHGSDEDYELEFDWGKGIANHSVSATVARNRKVGAL